MEAEVTKHEPLYQVWATEVATGNLVAVPFFPAMLKEAVDRFAGDMREMIHKGKEKRYVDPEVILCVRKS